MSNGFVGFVLVMKGCISHYKSKQPSATLEGNEKTVEMFSWEKLSTLSRSSEKLAGFSWMGSLVACACMYVLELE